MCLRCVLVLRCVDVYAFGLLLCVASMRLRCVDVFCVGFVILCCVDVFVLYLCFCVAYKVFELGLLFYDASIILCYYVALMLLCCVDVFVLGLCYCFASMFLGWVCFFCVAFMLLCLVRRCFCVWFRLYFVNYYALHIMTIPHEWRVKSVNSPRESKKIVSLELRSRETIFLQVIYR